MKVSDGMQNGQLQLPNLQPDTNSRSLVILSAVEELATLLTVSAATIDSRLESAAREIADPSSCPSPSTEALGYLHLANFAVDESVRQSLGRLGGSSNGVSDSDVHIPHGCLSTRLASLSSLFSSCAGQLVGEIKAATSCGVLDGGITGRAVLLVGEEALWLTLCFQVWIRAMMVEIDIQFGTKVMDSELIKLQFINLVTVAS